MGNWVAAGVLHVPCSLWQAMALGLLDWGACLLELPTFFVFHIELPTLDSAVQESPAPPPKLPTSTLPSQRSQ